MNSSKPVISYNDFDQTIALINQAERVQLFLDYDGTLAVFAPTPDDVFPDEELIQILNKLKESPLFQIAIVSGRRLAHVRRLIPIEGILLAGSYGIELLTPEGEMINRLDYDAVRPRLDILKPQWAAQINAREGFYLEDKGWSLAIHARFADEQAAHSVLEEALTTSQDWIEGDRFHILVGNKFLEVRPRIANKGDAVEYLFEHHVHEGALPVYVGDDDTDEEAFPVVNAHGGITVLVAHEPRVTQAEYRLDSPHSVRSWLRNLSSPG